VARRRRQPRHHAGLGWRPHRALAVMHARPAPPA
jgi:hypothetical protein